MTDFANIVWNPKNLTPVVVHAKNSGSVQTRLPEAAYIFVATQGSTGDIMTDMDAMTLINMIKPKYYVTDEENADLFGFCRQISVEPILIEPVLEPVQVVAAPVVRKTKVSPLDLVFSETKNE